MNNSIMSSKNAIVKNIIDAEPVVFGAGDASAQLVKFAYGTLDKAATAGVDGQIAFGYDKIPDDAMSRRPAVLIDVFKRNRLDKLLGGAESPETFNPQALDCATHVGVKDLE